MKKILLIPDSFKGTMSSLEICSIMKSVIKRRYPDCKVISIPVADGGEGSVDAFLSAMGGEKRTVTVSGPFFEKVEGFYGVLDGGKTAVIEMAACAGLPLAEDRKNPMLATTYGVGELMAHAVNSGCTKIIMGLGGSATNDGGTGAASALGVKFTNKDGQAFIPVGGTLCELEHIDISGLLKKLEAVEIIAMCDIDNPLYGESGAAFVFAPQKGATPEMTAELDAGLRRLSEVASEELHHDISTLSGAGAAGGMGGGMAAFFGARLQRGIETVLDAVCFDELLKDADMVFSGEGKIDSQSIRGKVVIGVAEHSKRANVPLIAIVGDIGDNIEAVYDMGVSAVFSINRVAVDYKEARKRAKEDLALTTENILRFIDVAKATRKEV